MEINLGKVKEEVVVRWMRMRDDAGESKFGRVKEPTQQTSSRTVEGCKWK